MIYWFYSYSKFLHLPSRSKWE